ncbi:ATP-binding cassette domain-containing protein [Aquipuribacter sp. MA13-6]|uniref:ATP-binding cassette domain-containing protein n=1 Tax=unclassified Aquipuribacter TaxID=2635084 RepID=UPI003EEDD831
MSGTAPRRPHPHGTDPHGAAARGADALGPDRRLPRAVSHARAPWFALLVGIGAAQGLAAVGVALLVERGFDVLLTQGAPLSGRPGLLIAAGLAVAVVVLGLARRAERVTAERVGQSYVVQVRGQLFSHLTRVPGRRLGAKNRGNMLLKFVGDLNALRQWVSLGLARLLVAGVAIGVAVAAVLVVDVVLGLGLGLVLLIGAAATGALAPSLLRTTRRARRRRARLTGEVTERLSHVGVVQAAGQERRERRRIGRRSSAVAGAMLARAKVAGSMRGVAEGTAVAATAVVLLVGAGRVGAGAVDTATVVAVMSIAGLLSGYLRDLGRVAEYAAAASVARDAVRSFLAVEPAHDPVDAPDLAPRGGAVSVVGVTVAGSLDDVTVTAPAGATVAVVGPNGAGKSSLVAVIARLLPADSGTVMIDRQDVMACSLRSVRQHVGMATPDLPLLKGSLERNVRYRLPRAEQAEVDRVVDLCGLATVVDTLPDGWRTDVGEGGSRLSAGQRARVMVARAALGDPAVLVLDEAEAHLDRHAAEVVDRVLDDRVGTTLVVTHRRELVARTDLVWHLRDGRVVEVGPPAQVLVGDGPTARLFAPADDGPAPLPVDAGRARATASGPATELVP